MNKDDILAVLKTDLRISVDESTVAGKNQCDILRHFIDMAIAEINQFGITINFESIEDCMLIENYSAWMYRRRTEQTLEHVPRYLQLSLNNRLLHEKAGGE